MVRLTTTISAILAAHGALANPVGSRTPYRVKDSHHVPRAWRRLRRAPADHIIDLQIGVKQNNFAELERHLYEVSDPDHPRYGQHLSAGDVKELVKPTDETLDLVHEWLEANGITPSGYSSAKDWIMVSLPVGTVERLLDTEYHVYEHKDGGLVARAPKWSLPLHLHDRIDTIQPTNSFFRARAEKFDHIEAPVYIDPKYTPPSNETLNAVCNVSSVTPECFQTLYSTKGYKTHACGKNKVGFNNYLGEHPIRTDTELFLAKYRPEAVSSARDFPQISIANGPGDYALTPEEIQSGTSKEANLDVQAIAGISWKTPIISYSTGGSPPFIPSASTPDNTNEPYLVWVNYLLGLESFPQVITTSYADDEQTVPESYARRVCQQFAQVGARGTSLLFSSGDSGVGPYGECISNDGKNTTQFLPEFPPSCPYVTAVGATKNFEPEVVAYRPAFVGPDGIKRGNYTSGGGFSNYFAAPAYQAKQASSYVENLDGLYDGLYNKTGRGYPDISAQGLYFAYFWNGTEGTISGTSASCPLTGGIISLVNDALISSGKPALGFLNPWLYSKGYKGLTDITQGSAVGCGVDGFPATEGWDPVTGLGTPVFPELVALAGGKLFY
ncbi:tripeptidyl-peptidase 1 precursor [Annulohypoxylon maeteangense]|uniref:tripeptidyl-peptidase 1 precursor n=1 Tax=Annulohypoxylon maeteangense TaxID=1927788 RepID=UPI0020078BFD|nr:tripeptidyl-peptidase 1 precursor [Annulohypoxylon maeteangense]KAI0880839.1 tripeptidyl-peptidase 1 precursor [Annulohypoxylon maeteangense]